MRLLKWLFQPAYLLLIIVIVALYVNREAVFPEEVAESLEAEALVAKIEDMTNGLREDVEEALESTDTADEVVEEVAAEEATAVAEAETSVEEPAPVAEVEAETVAEDAPAMPAEEPVVQEVTEEQPSEPEVAQPEPVQEPVEASAQAAPQQHPLTLWQQARSAVWQGDLDAAVSRYQELIAIEPDNYDAYGEMGNVLLAQSKAEAAAEAYAMAARLIYRSGNREIAYRVADIVLQLDPRQAEGLRREFAR